MNSFRRENFVSSFTTWFQRLLNSFNILISEILKTHVHIV